jgi:hypothetical protein
VQSYAIQNMHNYRFEVASSYCSEPVRNTSSKNGATSPNESPVKGCASQITIGAWLPGTAALGAPRMQEPPEMAPGVFVFTRASQWWVWARIKSTKSMSMLLKNRSSNEDMLSPSPLATVSANHSLTCISGSPASELRFKLRFTFKCLHFPLSMEFQNHPSRF